MKEQEGNNLVSLEVMLGGLLEAIVKHCWEQAQEGE